MKKMSLTGLLCGLFLLTQAQSGYNVFTQNIHFIPEPSAPGFLCGSTPSVAFTMGLTTQDDAPLNSTQPVKIKIVLTGFTFPAYPLPQVSGTYAANFSWSYDPLNTQCLIGTQQSILPGTGSDPLFPNPLSTGSIQIPLQVPSNLAPGSVLKVEAIPEIPVYMQSSNALFDDQESTQTQTYCTAISGCDEAPILSTSSRGWFCEGSNIELTAKGPAGSTFTWITPGTCASTMNSNAVGSSSLTWQNAQLACSGMYKVVQQKPGCTQISDTAYFPLQIAPKPQITYLTTTCNGNFAQVEVHTNNVTPLLYAINGGNFQTNPVLQTDLSSAFTVEVKAPGTDCITFYQGDCINCLNQIGCSATPSDSISAPAVACVAQPIALTGFFAQADYVLWESSGTGIFNTTQCNSSPCTVQYTPSAADILRGYVDILLQTNDPDSTGVCVAARSIKTIQLIDHLVLPTLSSNSPICVGDPLQLSATGVLGTLHWQTPDGFAFSGNAITRTNAQMTMGGSYTTTLSAEGCTSVNTSIPILIQSLPNVSMQIQETPEFCAGQANGKLAIQVSGGSGNYTICHNNTCIAHDSAMFQYLAPATYTITVYDQSCPLHAFTHTATVDPGVVVAPPVLSQNQLNLCEKQPLSLLANTSSGNQMVWTKYHSSFYNIGNPIYLGEAELSEAGCYYARALNAQGCASVPVSLQVEVTPLPVITQVDVHCTALLQSEIIIHTLNGSWLYSLDGVNYQTSNIFQHYAPGEYTVYVKHPSSNCSAQEEISIPNCACGIPVQANIELPLVACTGSPIPLDALFTGATQATWLSNGSGIIQNGTGASPLLASYIPSPADIDSGKVQFTLLLSDPDGSGPCTDVQIHRHMFLRDSLHQPLISTGASYCTGDSISLLTSNYNTPLNWYTPQDTFTQVAFAQLASVSSTYSGWYIAEAAGYNCSTKKDSVFITVQSAPQLTLTHSTLPEQCKGNGNGKIYLTVQGGSGFYQIYNDVQQNYQLSSSPIELSWMPSGNYIFRISDTACVHAAYQLAVSLPEGYAPNPPTAAFSNSPVCVGDTLQLYASGDAGSYLWSAMQHSFTDTGMSVFRPATSTQFSDVYKVQRIENGCASDYLTVQAKVYGIPEVLSMDTLCPGNVDAGSLFIHAVVSGNDSLAYRLNQGVYQDSPLFDQLSNGRYQVQVRTKGSTCESTPTAVELYCNCYCNKEASVQVFPVPNTGSFDLDISLYEEVETAILKLYDLSGRSIYQEIFDPEGLRLKHHVDLKQKIKGHFKLQLILDGVPITQSITIVE